MPIQVLPRSLRTKSPLAKWWNALRRLLKSW